MCSVMSRIRCPGLFGVCSTVADSMSWRDPTYHGAQFTHREPFLQLCCRLRRHYAGQRAHTDVTGAEGRVQRGRKPVQSICADRVGGLMDSIFPFWTDSTFKLRFIGLVASSTHGTPIQYLHLLQPLCRSVGASHQCSCAQRGLTYRQPRG
jgi:hypothetical protein